MPKAITQSTLPVGKLLLTDVEYDILVVLNKYVRPEAKSSFLLEIILFDII